MDPLKKKRETARFCNPELAKMVEDLVFDDPFWDAPNNKLNPVLRPAAEAFWATPGTRASAEELKLIYMQKAECLIHGDLHTGSFFIAPEELRIFDAEFAFYGPSGYDMGCVIGNLLLNWASWAAHPEVPAAQVKDYREFMEDQFIETYTEFAKTFSALWDTSVRAEFKSVPGLKERYLLTHMRESVGFAGCECARRSVGLAQVPDTSRIEDLELRAKAQRISLQMATHLLEDWNRWEHIEEVSGMLKRLVL
jgi:5-methylthioribose kinase